MTKCYYWQTNVICSGTRGDPEMCIKCLVALVHFGCEINCCAELHVSKENCVKSFEKVKYYREM